MVLSLTLSRVEDPILYCSMWNRGGGGCRGLLLLFVALLTLASSSAGVHIRGKAFHTIVKRRVRDLFPPERMALMNREASAHSLGRVAQIDRERLVDFWTNIFLEVAPYPMKTESKDGDGDEPHGAGDYNPLTGTMNLGQIHRAPVESECDTLAQGFTRGCAIKAAMDGGQGVISGGGNAKLSKIHQDCKAVLREMQRCIFSRT